MKCFLHIGTEKTGTTSIQKFFSINREKLASDGYYYLNSLGSPNNRLISIIAYHEKRRDSFIRNKGISSDEELKNYQNKLIEELKKEIAALPSNAKVIISNEHIQSRLTRLDEIEKLKAVLKSVGLNDIELILYLRNPAETANSLFSTSIKSRGVLLDVPSPTQKYFNNICNHKETIKKFASIFGEDKLSVRLFRKDKLKNESLISDVLALIGITKSEESFVIPKPQNEGLSLLGLLILQRLNKSLPLKQKQVALKLVSKNFSQPKFVMKSSIFEEYNAFFKESNEWVRKHFFPEEKELFPTIIPEESKLEIHEKDLESISNFIHNLIINPDKTVS